MPVLKTTSPIVSPTAPRGLPSYTVPSLRTSLVATWFVRGPRGGRADPVMGLGARQRRQERRETRTIIPARFGVELHTGPISDMDVFQRIVDWLNNPLLH